MNEGMEREPTTRRKERKGEKGDRKKKKKYGVRRNMTMGEKKQIKRQMR